MKKSVVPFVSVVAFAVIASNSVHAAGVNQDDLAIAALSKLSVQATAQFKSAPITENVSTVPANIAQVQVLNESVIGKSQVKAIITKELKHSLKITKSDLLGSESNYDLLGSESNYVFNLFGTDPIYVTYTSTTTAMLTD